MRLLAGTAIIRCVAADLAAEVSEYVHRSASLAAVQPPASGGRRSSRASASRVVAKIGLASRRIARRAVGRIASMARTCAPYCVAQRARAASYYWRPIAERRCGCSWTSDGKKQGRLAQRLVHRFEHEDGCTTARPVSRQLDGKNTFMYLACSPRNERGADWS